MRSICLLLFVLLCFAYPTKATHIVGGEFALTWKGRGANFQLTLTIYFNDFASHSLIDPGAHVYIFENGTKKYIQDFVLPLTSSDKFVQYETPNCARSDIRTRILTYTKDIYLDPNVYNSPNGYFVEWERCCRNQAIDNIVNPLNTGAAYYLQFPPVRIGNNYILNSSPQFKPIKGEYFCLGRMQKYDFSATDANGDSLVYYLATPFMGNATIDTVDPGRDPNPTTPIQWASGYSVNNEIPGNPPLSIDPHTGILSVKPDQKGLYVMSVQVDEYRNGVKIGTNKRDFQFKVVDCPYNYPPHVRLVNPSGGYFSAKDTIMVDFGSTDCYNLQIIDSTALTQVETVHLQQTGTIPPTIISLNNQTVSMNRGNPIAYDRMCITTCNTLLQENDSLYTLSVIGSNNACPTPGRDTMSILVLVKGHKSKRPKIGLLPNLQNYNLVMGDSVSFQVYGTDRDSANSISLSMNGEGFDAGSLGMTFTAPSGSDSIAGAYFWKPDCNALKKSPLSVTFTISGGSPCVPSQTDTTSVTFNIVDHATEITKITVPNLVTPNGDGKNDEFTIPNIPEGNCTYFFASIQVYNRWGALVFESSSKDFKWDLSQIEDGLYFYLVDLKGTQLRGWLQVLGGTVGGFKNF